MKRNLVAYCEIPKGTVMIIYHGKRYSKHTTDVFIEEGINIDIQKGDNFFIVSELETSILNSSLKFELTDKGTFRSLKPIDTDIGSSKVQEYKKDIDK